jgi:hypothetical protein
VFVICALLAILVGLFYAIIRPSSYDHSWRRLIGALVFSVTLFIIGVFFYVTDQPGYYYVPFEFSMVSLALILLFIFAQRQLAQAVAFPFSGPAGKRILTRQWIDAAGDQRQ